MNPKIREYSRSRSLTVLTTAQHPAAVAEDRVVRGTSCSPSQRDLFSPHKLLNHFDRIERFGPLA